MSIRISKGRKGSTIRASGKDAQALFDALCRSIGEPTLSEQRAEQDKKQPEPAALAQYATLAGESQHGL